MINKKIVLIISLIIFILILTIILLLKKTEITPAILPELTPTPTVEPYQVISVSPPDRASRVPLDPIIEISFNKPASFEIISFYIDPNIDFDTSIEDKKLIIKPKTVLKKGTMYTYIVKYKNQLLPSQTYSFVTEGTFIGLPNTQPSGAVEGENAFLKQTHPDGFIKNQLPGNTSTYNVKVEDIGGANSHFRFIVTQKTSQGKQDFLKWLESLNFSDDALSKLDIVFN